MSKSAVFCVLTALLLATALAAPADAQVQECCEATVDVYLTIMPYCCVQLTGDVEVVVDEESCQGPGPLSGTGFAEVWACSNFPASMEAILELDVGFPGAWACYIDGELGTIPFGPGETSAPIDLAVTGLSCEDYAREMEWIGTLSVVICPLP